MEHQIFEPINRGPRHRRVELKDLALNQPAAVVPENSVNPASPEHIDYLWQREAAFSALRGIQEVAARGGLHRREESFVEVARDEVASRARRLFGKIASIGSGLREWGRDVRERLAPAEEFGRLADLGFPEPAYNRPVVEHHATWTANNVQVPDSPARVTGTFSTEELAELQQLVRERRMSGGTVYESQNM